MGGGDDSKGTAERMARLLVIGIMFVVLVAPVMGWYLMLLMGILHHEIHAAIPAIGYWPSTFIAALMKPLLFYVTKTYK